MEIVHDEAELQLYVIAAVGVTPDRPILIDRYLENAIETSELTRRFNGLVAVEI
jgi:hypothetical protein